MSRPTDEATQVLTDPTAYANETRLHSAFAHLRTHAPVSWADHPPYRPFWAITKYADIIEIERDNALWLNAPRLELLTATAEDLHRAQQDAGAGLRMLVHMDGRRHRLARAIGADWFRPKAMRALAKTVDELAKRYVDEMSNKTECDFVTEVAVNLPLYVIMSLLGLPDRDFSLLRTLTQQVFGKDDQEFQRTSSQEGFLAAVADIFAYFAEVTASRRAQPTEDIASAIANARIDGESLSEMETLSYYMLIMTAGHDTTSSAIAGGLRALVEHPAELERLRKHPDLMPTAVEEMIRCSSPAKHFMRTATHNTEVRGVPIAAGESVCLAYVSGNHDEEIFDEPFRFDIARNPNKHLAFGYGAHFCLGAALARMEIKSFYSELVPRLKAIEPAGEARLSNTIFVGGLKHLPIRYRLR